MQSGYKDYFVIVVEGDQTRQEAYQKHLGALRFNRFNIFSCQSPVLNTVRQKHNAGYELAVIIGASVPLAEGGEPIVTFGNHHALIGVRVRNSYPNILIIASTPDDQTGERMRGFGFTEVITQISKDALRRILRLPS